MRILLKLTAAVFILLIACRSSSIASSPTASTSTQAAKPTATTLPPNETPVPTTTETPEPSTTPTPAPSLTATPVPSPTVIPTATPENQIFRDDFSGSLQPGWTWESENPDLWTITDDGWLQIIGEDPSLLGGDLQSNVLWYSLPEGDFEITAHIQAQPIADFQQATIYIYEDVNNYIAINRGYCSPCTPGGNAIYMEYKINEVVGAYHVATDAADVYLRLVSQGNTISGYYAVSPDDWHRMGRFGNYFTFRKVGLGVSNVDNGSINADLVGLFDYFEIRKP
jgi:beta-xylosidase